MSVYAVGEGSAGFPKVKSITFSTLKLINQFWGLVVSMGDDRIGEVGNGAREK